MLRIVIIDDDFASEAAADVLRYAGYQVTRYSTAEQALANRDSIAAANLVVLDIIMQRPQNMPEAQAHGGHRTGRVLLSDLRATNPQLPVLVFSATQDQALIRELQGLSNTAFLAKDSAPSQEDFLQAVSTLLGGRMSKPLPQSFIVHGHDEQSKYALKNYLQNTLGLPEPIILHEQPSLGRTIIEKLEAYAFRATLVFVLMTPDDRAASPTDTNDDKRRARQNVIFELGYFLGLLGRKSGCVILLYKHPLELPSDITGIIYIDISGGIEAAGETLRKELHHVGISP